jgi:uncharacterized protein (DUF2062 family)/cyclopropane fatty-acyl-phospholipid synthase-like methyltransferase
LRFQPTRLQRLVHALRSEGASRPREAWAIGLGVFIGCSPLIGLHLALAIGLGWLFGLNRIKVYLAANLVNPLVLPFVLLAEVQSGSWLRRGHTYPLTIDAVKSMNVWHLGSDLLIGSLVVGGLLGTLIGVATYASLRHAYHDPEFTRLVRDTADRYVGTSVAAWEFARAKLRRDPVYRTALTAGWLPVAGRLLDIGCGQGLLLALVAQSRAMAAVGTWPAGWAPAPVSLELAGIELRTRMCRFARHALGDQGTVMSADVREVELGRADVIACFDVLHLMDASAQRDLVARAAGALTTGGCLLVREADASAGWRFLAVRLGNRLTALARGRWSASFTFRSAAEWKTLLEQAGLTVSVHAMSDGTPFANVLLVARRP